MTTTTTCSDLTEAAQLLAEAADELAHQANAWAILARACPDTRPDLAEQAASARMLAVRAARHLGVLVILARDGRLDLATADGYIDAGHLMHDGLESGRRLILGIIRQPTTGRTA